MIFSWLHDVGGARWRVKRDKRLRHGLFRIARGSPGVDHRLRHAIHGNAVRDPKLVASRRRDVLARKCHLVRGLTARGQCARRRGEHRAAITFEAREARATARLAAARQQHGLLSDANS